MNMAGVARSMALWSRDMVEFPVEFPIEFPETDRCEIGEMRRFER
jgi:hypothetical protein